MESSFFSEMVLHEHDQNQCNLMDYIDDELAFILESHFPNFNDHNLSPTGSDSSTSSALMINAVAAAGILDSPPIVVEPPAKQRKLNDTSKFSSLKGGASLNFGDPKNSEQNDVVLKVCETEEEEKNRGVVKARNRKSRVRPPSQTYDHIIAERKRRELLSERFVALSAIVPGLKKMDKTSVLGDAIKYMKELQEKVQTLEEKVAKQTVESVVLVKRSHITTTEEDQNGCSDYDKNCRTNEHSLPEIEARVCNTSILLKIHCEKRKGTLMQLLGQVEKLNLSVVTTNVTSFGGFSLDVTIIAEMEKGFNTGMDEVVRTLRSALLACS